MITLLIGLAAQAALASAPINPHAVALFERDAELKAWALKLYDRNGDGWLTSFEAQPALAAAE